LQRGDLRGEAWDLSISRRLKNPGGKFSRGRDELPLAGTFGDENGILQGEHGLTILVAQDD